MNKQCIAQLFFSPNHQHTIQVLASNISTQAYVRVQTCHEARRVDPSRYNIWIVYYLLDWFGQNIIIISVLLFN
jgi:hypothetical protein